MKRFLSLLCSFVSVWAFAPCSVQFAEDTMTHVQTHPQRFRDIDPTGKIVHSQAVEGEMKIDAQMLGFRKVYCGN